MIYRWVQTIKLLKTTDAKKIIKYKATCFMCSSLQILKNVLSLYILKKKYFNPFLFVPFLMTCY